VKPIKVCLISLKSYPLFTKNSLDYFGGAEVQISLIAKALAKDKKFQVSVIVGDYGQKATVKQNRLTLYRSFKHGRFFPFEVGRFSQLLRKINADIYTERTINPKILLVYLFCRLFKKKFFYMVAHDWDLNHRIIKLADLIIAQTKDQQKQLLNSWKLSSFLFPSILPNNVIPLNANKQGHFILWVGRAEKWKQAEIFLKLVSYFPQQKFIMVCRLGHDFHYYQKLFTRLQPLPNLEFYNDIPFAQINDFFKQAKILVNTSICEGFPNTFLQAGLNQVPILSLTVNPDNFISRYRCGLVADNNINQLINNCQKLLKNHSLARSFGKNNFRYVNSHHNKMIRLKQKLQCLAQV